jgi:YHS domain-containing protein
MIRKSLITISATALLALAACSSNKSTSENSAPESTAAAIPAVDLKNTVCPVSGDKVGDSNDVVVYDGKVYHMCCPDCHKQFVADPQKYSAAVTADPAKYGAQVQ